MSFEEYRPAIHRSAAVFTDAIYCICVRGEDDRAEAAKAHFREIGLDTPVIFHRPPRGTHLEAAVWTSHRNVARHARAHGFKRILVLEDDVVFTRRWVRVARRARKAISRLRDDWWGFFLGHIAFQAYPVARDVMRVRAVLTHAYVANAPLIDWLADTRVLDARLPMIMRAPSIDRALANLPGMYALFPLVAVQRAPDVFRIDRKRTPLGAKRSFFSFDRHRYWIITYGPRPAEILALALSPVHWISMSWRNRKTGQVGRTTRMVRAATIIRDSGHFDDAYYFACNPDIDPSTDPLYHYIAYGANEGRNPNAGFDTRRYLAECPQIGDMNPLEHYVRIGASKGLAAWYQPPHERSGDPAGCDRKAIASDVTSIG